MGFYLGRRISHFISLLAYEWPIDNFLSWWNCSQCLITASVIETEVELKDTEAGKGEISVFS